MSASCTGPVLSAHILVSQKPRIQTSLVSVGLHAKFGRARFSSDDNAILLCSRLLPVLTMTWRRHPVGGPFSTEVWRFVIIAELWRRGVARPENFVFIFAFLSWKTTLCWNFNFFPKVYMTIPIDVVFKCRKICPTGNRWNLALFAWQKNFGCLLNCRYSADRVQNLLEPAPNSVFTVLQISSKSVHFRRSHQPPGQFTDEHAGLLSIFSKSIADIRYRYRLKKYRRYRYRYFAVKVSISISILRYRYFYSDHTVATSVDGREPRDYGVRKHSRVAS